MIISSTGIAYLFAFLATSFLSYRFFRYWQKSKDSASKLFFFFILPWVLFFFIKAVAGIFFVENSQILIASIHVGPFLQGLSCAVALYIVTLRKFPRISPWIGFSIVFGLGLAATYLTFNLSFSPILGQGGAISWGLPSSFVYLLLRATIILIGIFPLAIVIFQDYRTFQEPRAKTRAFGFFIILLSMTGFGVSDFIFAFANYLKPTPLFRDVGLGIIAIAIFIVVLKTQKNLPKKRTSGSQKE